MVLSLLLNMTLLVTLVSIYDWVARRWNPSGFRYRVLSGLLFGLIACLGMMVPFRASTGVQYDGRSVIMLVAGIFGGPVVASVAAVIAAAYRLYLGGAGAWVGVGVIAESMLLGSAYGFIRKRVPEHASWPLLFALAFVVHVIMLLIQLALPGGIGPAIVAQIWLPVLVLFPLGTLLVCRLMFDQEARIADEVALKQLNDTLEQTVEVRTRELREANERLWVTTEQLSLTNQDLEAANQAKTEFLNAMGHELRTPLNSIIGFSKLLERGEAGPVNEEQERQLDMINRSGRRLLDMVSGVLELSRIEAHVVNLSFERFDARALVREVADALEPDASAKGLAVIVDVPASGVRMTTDRGKVGQILTNLGGNAVKFTRQGHVTLAVRHLGVDGVAFTVSDTGPGISDEFRERLFAQFVQQDYRVEGTGLGLAISQGLVEVLGGTIEVESRDGEGATFTVVLPATGPADEDARPPSP